jgi:alkanesulfonate monooxygenase SsuD/methylene tetrahydromethanopterin reductase-like flavin-dependent oxidoreductase (luciferase family)
VALRHGLYIQTFGDLADPRVIAGLAADAERAGWDGLFVYDHIFFGNAPTVDPWITLAACATRTERLVLGPMIVPLARRHPAKVAHEVAALVRLAGARVVVGVGLGVIYDFRPSGDLGGNGRAQHSRRLDLHLQIVRGLLDGTLVDLEDDDGVEPIRFKGRLAAPPAEHVPVWSAVTWDRSTGVVRGAGGGEGPLQRAGRVDGLFPVAFPWDAEAPIDPDELDAVLESARARGVPLRREGYDVVACGRGELMPVERCVAAGATWRLEFLDGDPEDARGRVRAGPPGG